MMVLERIIVLPHAVQYMGALTISTYMLLRSAKRNLRHIHTVAPHREATLR